MELVLAIVIGGLYAAGLYLMMRRNIGKIIIGIALLSHGANLLIFTSGGLTRADSPLLPRNHAAAGAMADPLPQALILTAIVISFGVTAFLLVLAQRTHHETGVDDVDDLRKTDT